MVDFKQFPVFLFSFRKEMLSHSLDPNILLKTSNHVFNTFVIHKFNFQTKFSTTTVIPTGISITIQNKAKKDGIFTHLICTQWYLQNPLQVRRCDIANIGRHEGQYQQHSQYPNGKQQEHDRWRRQWWQNQRKNQQWNCEAHQNQKWLHTEIVCREGFGSLNTLHLRPLNQRVPPQFAFHHSAPIFWLY